MGAFYLVFEPDPEHREREVAKLQAAFAAQGFVDCRRLRLPHLSAGFYGKHAGSDAQLSVDEHGGFVGLCGTLMVDAKVGAQAAEVLKTALPATARGARQPDWSTLIGNYCVLHGDAQRQRLFVDPLGVYKVYTDRAQRIFCSSFLALASALNARTPNPQGVYEYVHQEATYGEDTVLAEVRQARSQGAFEFTDEVRFHPWAQQDQPHVDAAPMDQHIERILQRLRVIFAAMGQCFGDRIDTALSGGYDSRLTLALLHEQRVQPAVHVYGRANSADVEVARRVAVGESFHLDHFDKSTWPQPTADEFPRVVEANYLAFDGWPPSGIFDSGVDLATRRERAGKERLMLNGGGGEIFRNFFYLPSWVHSPRQVVHAFYNRYAPAWCTAEFDEARYCAALQDKLCATVGVQSQMSREQVEAVYPRFRCGFWMGRNNAINNRFGWTMTPFIDPELVQLALRVPLSMKNHGRLEAAMIARVSPRLASYLSDYGHDFTAEPPPSRVIKDWLTMLRPPSLRRLTYRLRFAKPLPRPTLVSGPYLDEVIERSMPRMSKFYRVDAVNDPGAFARIATLEYLFTRLAVS